MYAAVYGTFAFRCSTLTVLSPLRLLTVSSNFAIAGFARRPLVEVGEGRLRDSHVFLPFDMRKVSQGVARWQRHLLNFLEHSLV